MHPADGLLGAAGRLCEETICSQPQVSANKEWGEGESCSARQEGEVVVELESEVEVWSDMHNFPETASGNDVDRDELQRQLVRFHGSHPQLRCVDHVTSPRGADLTTRTADLSQYLDENR